MLNICSIGLTLLIIIGFGLLFHVLIKVTPEEAWASAIMTILLLVFITGIVGNSLIAVGIVALLAIVGIGLGIIFAIQKNTHSILTFFSPGIVMLLGIAGVGVITFRGMMVCNWDELYQWGKAANFMVEFDKLPRGVEFSGEVALLSSTTFFHYFMGKISYLLTGGIVESNYYVSNLLLWFSALALPFSGDTWKNWKRVWSFGVFQFLLAALIFVQPYYNIYTDQATAYWSGAMIAWMLLKKFKARNAYLIPLVLVNVGLMKSMVGPLFAVVVIIALFVIYVTSNENKESFLKNWKKFIRSKKGIATFCAILSPFVLIGVWSAITGQNGLLRFHFNTGAVGEENRSALTLKSMIGWIFKSVNLQDDKLFLSYGIFIILTLGLVFVIYPIILDKMELKRFNRIMYLYIAGFVGYFFVMYFAYMTVFGYVDSVRAMSLNRYYSDYMMLGVIPLTVVLFVKTGKETKSKVTILKKAVIFLGVLCIIYGTSDYFLQNLSHVYAVDTKNYAEREKMDKYAKQVKEITNGTGKIYFINQSKSGLFTLVADYELGEQVSRGGMCYKFRADTSEAIIGLTEYPIESLPVVLREQGYEYVWVYSANDYLKDNFKTLFGLKQVSKGSFYKVVDETDAVKLEYVEKIK